MDKLLVITGPTASGKSSLALHLAQIYPLEIISADSMQVYRHMDIGTDKVPKEIREQIPHHLIDIKYPDEPWSVEEFQRRATQAIEEIQGRGRLPCVVGGTGFYIQALLYDFPLENAPPNPELRNRLRETAQVKGNVYVHSILKGIDPESYETLHPNDLKRVIRAIEYYEATKKPISERKRLPNKSPYDTLLLGLKWDRQQLYEKIDDRVEEQFAKGLVDEVMHLFEMGYGPDLPSMQGIGYKEVGWMLYGLITESEAKNILKRNTRRYAKRQFTWFKNVDDIIWLPFGKDVPIICVVEDASREIDNWLSKQ
ncbi:MAG TPA: tRNA (adenosine(37)-N6)-dimethylallyltransferase MiaA [Bacillota bacterium]|nr:tRNA (adenosine(37)-N6)-dimethylallyltransferase MiaA [Candidatus Fermentithermobacillaceae bacterium]HOB29936.1 tRNA (adenosine(37)-N6)-dimethylallyltransferase MiaA [Bacillota bacterium]HOL11506.1 tRNA (adenosine(37)-N6)-dimethylallyltransferase MiaA [Bacillota bacterium]HOQ02563.1 tRNA (adenosine(37)-N6)-dimethylallyltransferase MiaA [Bacillota bacterium]HPV13381.1 tRNA (adenosine(37)-N6)-dimethylallyltransferase MiaA [Bacillota bacterium]